MENIKTQFKNLPTWQKYFLIIGLPIFVSLYIWFILISPLMDEINRLKLEKDQAEREIANLKNSMRPAVLNNLRREKERLEQEYEQRYKELTSMVGEIPTEGDVPKIIRNIGSLAMKSRVVILNLQMSSPQKVSYELIQEGNRKVVKEVQQQQQTQQKQQKQQQKQTQGVSFLRSEMKIVASGSYNSIRKFLDMLAREGVVSYPSNIVLTPEEGNKVKAEITLFLIMKEEGQ